MTTITKIEKFGRIEILTIEIKTWSDRLIKAKKQEYKDAILARIVPMVAERVALIKELGIAPAGA